ncbi:hypothetical protein CRM22_001119 [Opisthorchis felineus]|uniref:28S ribosomal protein S22, mitochondrial n=1 Tax=Opisthorchis felineus TaxID=147828 RepID=A0A4S2MCA2_OPIFE|nr:hypothetical protein CRM22_001119 [Opisthorchis felineus]
MPFRFMFPVHTTRLNAFTPRRSFSKTTKDLQDLFADPKVHTLLRLITYSNPNVVHQPWVKKFQKDKIQLLSDQELQTVKQFSVAFTNQRLQMPPVLAVRDENDTLAPVISKDEKLQGLLPSNYKLVFTDISAGETPRRRLIVVREPDGTLRHASASERDRINSTYFLLPGRRVRVPLMFYGQHLQDMLNRGQYLYILDRACNQFEPDDPEYIRICHSVYNHVNANSWAPIHSTTETDPTSTDNPLRLLRHTRHYGPLALYLIAYLGSPGGLVYEALQCQHYARLGWLLRLVLILRPASPFAVALKECGLPPPPPAEVDVGTYLADQSRLPLTSADIQNILSYVQMFVDREPLADSQKRLLMQHVEACREGLAASCQQEALG